MIDILYPSFSLWLSLAVHAPDLPMVSEGDGRLQVRMPALFRLPRFLYLLGWCLGAGPWPEHIRRMDGFCGFLKAT